MDVETQPSRGATFTIYLPCENAETGHGPHGTLSIEDVSGGSETILLIEDEELLRDLVKAVIESKGYNVLTAKDGEEGIETFKLHKDEIAVVISDFRTPERVRR